MGVGAGRCVDWLGWVGAGRVDGPGAGAGVGRETSAGGGRWPGVGPVGGRVDGPPQAVDAAGRVLIATAADLGMLYGPLRWVQPTP